MPRLPINDSGRISIRIKPDDKALFLRAAALQRLDLTSFIIYSTSQAAHQLIEQSERMQLEAPDSLTILGLLETPPQPTPDLKSAARQLPEDLFL
ncbi:MAG TPA: DUF1778 domain-containing protein [Bryobacteraceae bacterium]|nr:DUF1778 domain-containing protein [Bryobacteraceae bacterium]